MAENGLMTVGEVADLLRVHLMTVYEWLNSGALKGYKVGVQWRVKREDAEAMLKEQPIKP